MARTKQVAHKATGSGKTPRKTLVKGRSSAGLGSSALAPPVRRPHRFRPGTRAIMEIRQQQKSTAMCFAKRPFIGLVRDIVIEQNGPGRFARAALEVLQVAAEDFILGLLARANDFAVARGVQTVHPCDLAMAASEADRIKDMGLTRTVCRIHEQATGIGAFPGVRIPGTPMEVRAPKPKTKAAPKPKAKAAPKVKKAPVAPAMMEVDVADAPAAPVVDAPVVAGLEAEADSEEEEEEEEPAFVPAAEEDEEDEDDGAELHTAPAVDL